MPSTLPDPQACFPRAVLQPASKKPGPALDKTGPMWVLNICAGEQIGLWYTLAGWHTCLEELLVTWYHIT